MGYLNTKFHLTTFQIILLGFAGTILIGSLLLMTPLASRSGEVTPFLDTLFTATSAVCVTGLIVKDTATYWTFFGQAVIIILIQIGGMGFITLAITFSRLTGKKIGLVQRSAMQEAISAPQVGGMVRLTSFIVSMTFLFEGLGALAMFPVFAGDFGWKKGIWLSVFHSISAFCNAGFDLMGTRAPFSSLVSYQSNADINITIMLLIVTGGIGFLTWNDIKNHGLRFKEYRTQSKTILVTTAFLIIIPAVVFFFMEFKDLPLGTRILSSFFQSVTPRTAGFNTADYSKFSDDGIALTIVLMLIGGSPGSTAGGMKTTTIAVLLATMLSVFKRQPSAAMFRRRIADESIRNAMTIFVMYVTLFLLGGMIISHVEQLPLQSCLFETASAVGTVGLTLGLTAHLQAVSKVILILLMYFGRVGGLTMIFAAVARKDHGNAKLLMDKITVG